MNDFRCREFITALNEWPGAAPYRHELPLAAGQRHLPEARTSEWRKARICVNENASLFTNERPLQILQNIFAARFDCRFGALNNADEIESVTSECPMPNRFANYINITANNIRPISELIRHYAMPAPPTAPTPAPAAAPPVLRPEARPAPVAVIVPITPIILEDERRPPAQAGSSVVIRVTDPSDLSFFDFLSLKIARINRDDPGFFPAVGAGTTSATLFVSGYFAFTQAIQPRLSRNLLQDWMRTNPLENHFWNDFEWVYFTNSDANRLGQLFGEITKEFQDELDELESPREGDSLNESIDTFTRFTDFLTQKILELEELLDRIKQDPLIDSEKKQLLLTQGREILADLETIRDNWRQRDVNKFNQLTSKMREVITKLDEALRDDDNDGDGGTLSIEPDGVIDLNIPDEALADEPARPAPEVSGEIGPEQIPPPADEDAAATARTVAIHLPPPHGSTHMEGMYGNHPPRPHSSYFDFLPHGMYVFFEAAGESFAESFAGAWRFAF